VYPDTTRGEAIVIEKMAPEYTTTRPQSDLVHSASRPHRASLRPIVARGRPWIGKDRRMETMRGWPTKVAPYTASEGAVVGHIEAGGQRRLVVSRTLGRSAGATALGWPRRDPAAGHPFCALHCCLRISTPARLRPLYRA
jgi:hypothetical protein